MLEKYFYPMVNRNEIFRTADEQGTIIVYEFKTFRIMTFDSLFEQSKASIGNPLYIDHEYIQAMLLPLLHMNPKHATLLGLGGGCLASCLYCVFQDVQLVAVEWREAIIDIAYNYFDLPRDERLQVKHQDAAVWLDNAPDNSSDMIFSDLYHALTMNELQLEKEFFENCHRVLTDHGWLALNFHKLPSADSLAMNNLCQLFPSVFMLHVNTDNWVLIACKQEMPLSVMMAAPPNNYLPASLASTLESLQPRLLKVNRKRKIKSF